MDPRGILYPAQLPTFERRPPSPAAAELVRWFWVTRWDIAPGRTSRQEVLAFPALNLVVEPGGTGLAGATTVRSHRDLVGTGWAVGTLLRPAATPGVTDDAQALLDAYVPVSDGVLHGTVAAAMARRDLPGACAAVEAWLIARVPTVPDEARLANLLAERIEVDEDVVTVDDAAAAVGISTRTAQRLARRYVGLTPLQLIHRRRLQHAADTVRSRPERSLADVAAENGYADQAHLIRDFRKVLGFTPGGYRHDVRG